MLDKPLENMVLSPCPPWIPPGNVFRVHVSVDKYTLINEYGEHDIEAQEHDLWFDSSNVYTLNGFIDDMETKIKWGLSQQLLLWGVDIDSGTNWKVISNEQFEEMIMCRMDVKVMHVACEVVEKDVAVLNDVGSRANKGASLVGATSSVTIAGHATHAEGSDDTCNTPGEGRREGNIVDWSTLIVLSDGDYDGEALEVGRKKTNKDDIEATEPAAASSQALEPIIEPDPVPHPSPESAPPPAAPTPRTLRTSAAAARERQAAATQVEDSPGPVTKRRLNLEGSHPPQLLEMIIPPPAKKITPRKKQLASKVKKNSPS